MIYEFTNTMKIQSNNLYCYSWIFSFVIVSAEIDIVIFYPKYLVEFYYIYLNYKGCEIFIVYILSYKPTVSNVLKSFQVNTFSHRMRSCKTVIGIYEACKFKKKNGLLPIWTIFNNLQWNYKHIRAPSPGKMQMLLKIIIIDLNENS